METQEKNKNTQEEGCHLIKRSALIQLFKTNYKLSKMLILVTYACEVKNLEITLTAQEVCELLKIKPSILEDCRKKNWIKAWGAGGYKYYKAYDVASLAERIDRRKMLRSLSKLPIVYPRS